MKLLVMLSLGAIMVMFSACSTQQTTPPLTIEDVTTSPIESAVELPVVAATKILTIDSNCKPRTWSSEWEAIILESLSSKPYLKNLNNNPKFYVGFIKALAKAESCLNVTEQYLETGLGKDAVTGKQNTSEGLLQLSYQDSKYHGCAFDWAKDKTLSVKDINKTIYNPKINIECGMLILEKQVKKLGVLTTKSSPYYWAVLNRTNKRFKEFYSYLKAEGFDL